MTAVLVRYLHLKLLALLFSNERLRHFSLVVHLKLLELISDLRHVLLGCFMHSVQLQYSALLFDFELILHGLNLQLKSLIVV